MNILAFFTKYGEPATGLTPTIRIREIPAGTLVVTDDLMTEVGDGFYNYDFTSYDSNKDYSIRSDGGVTLPESERYVYAGNENYIQDIENANDNISTQLTSISGSIDNISTDLISISGDIQVIDNNISSISNTVNNISTDLISVSGNIIKIDTNLIGISGSIDNISTDLISVSGSIDNISTDLVNISASIYENQDYLKRIVGLVHENIYIDNPTFDSDGNMTAARLRIYSDPLDVGTDTNVIGTYQISAPGDGPGKFTSWSQIRIS